MTLNFDILLTNILFTIIFSIITFYYASMLFVFIKNLTNHPDNQNKFFNNYKLALLLALLVTITYLSFLYNVFSTGFSAYFEKFNYPVEFENLLELFAIILLGHGERKLAFQASDEREKAS